MSSIPSQMQAVVISNKAWELKDLQVPQLEENDLLVKVDYVALNPTDWKHARYIGVDGAICGCDYSGTVVKLGSGLKNGSWKEGDKIAGMVHGGKFPNKGSFAQYLKVESDLAFKVPEGFSQKDASSYGVPYTTAMQVSHRYQSLPQYPKTVSSSGDAPWYLVYGGSSSVGLFQVQIAKAAGYRVVATASEKNHKLVKEYGADEVVDYRDESACISTIKKITNDTLAIGLDCISTESSVRISLSAFGDAAQGKKKLNTLLPQPEPTKEISKKHGIEVENTLAYTLMGKGFNFAPGMDLPAVPEDRAYYVELNKVTPEQLTSGPKWRPNPLVEGSGLEGVVEGLGKLERNEVSASKLVYKL